MAVFLTSMGGVYGICAVCEKNGHFRGVFRDFLSEFVEDAKTFLVAKQQPQAGPKTPTGTVKKLEQLCKNRFFDNFFDPP